MTKNDFFLGILCFFSTFAQNSTEMKQNHTFLIAIFLITTLIGLSACTQFSDGPKLSLRSTKSKLANTWQMKEAVKNGVEITEQYKNGFFVFTESGDFATVDLKRMVQLPPFTQDTLLPVLANGKWGLLDANRMEILYAYTFVDPYNTSVTYNQEVYEEWDILRLTTSELWIRNDSMRFKLIPQ